MLSTRSKSQLISAILEISNSPLEAIRHPVIEAEIQMARCRMFFHHHPIAIDFQLPREKASTDIRKQENYSDKFRECR